MARDTFPSGEPGLVVLATRAIIQRDLSTDRQPMSDAKPLEVRPPLALPSGSVRAILTLIVVAVVIAELARGHDLDIVWTETVMIALAHYFTSRRFIQLPGEVIQRLKAEGHLDEEAQPLFLPRHTIRAMIFVAFVGLAVSVS
jgi:hypothetical protein